MVEQDPLGMMEEIRVQWSEHEPVINVSNADELEQVLGFIAHDSNFEYPDIVLIEAHGCRVYFGLGREESFAQFEPLSGDPPYLVSVGESGAEGVTVFYLFGIHPTEIPRRYLIPTAQVRRILREWIRTATRPPDVEWEEI